MLQTQRCHGKTGPTLRPALLQPLVENAVKHGVEPKIGPVQEAIGKTLAQLNMTMGVFVIDGGDNWKTSLATGKQEFKDTFVKACRDAVPVAKRVNAKWATVVPGDFERALPIGIQTGNVIEALRRGAEILEPHGLIIHPL